MHGPLNVRFQYMDMTCSVLTVWWWLLVTETCSKLHVIEYIAVLGLKDILVSTTTQQDDDHQMTFINPLNAELNPICHLLALLGVHFLHVSRIRVKSLTPRLLMSHTHTHIYIYIYIAGYIYIYIYIYIYRGFKPSRSRRIFKGEKIISTPSFGGEVKPSVSYRRFATCKRSTELRGCRILGEICGNISRPRRVSPSAARGLSRRWTWSHLAEKVGTSKGGGKKWQPTPKKWPRMQRARAIPVAWLGSGSC